MPTIVRALEGALQLLQLELLELHLKMSILGKIHSSDTVNLKFSEILKCMRRKTEEEGSTQGISF